MRSLRFKQVDVFTRVPFRGNPVAVVLEGDGLDGAQMQRIAGWTNLSETTFVLKPTAPGADYRLRIFTPRHELPFAGHPTIGSAHAVLEAGIVKPAGGRMRQECGAGVLDLEAGEGGQVWVRAPQQSVKPLEPREIPALERALGAEPVAAPLVVELGPVWIVADLGSAAAVDGLAPDLAALAGLSDRLRASGATVFGAAQGPAAVHVRSFAPAQGIAEDPVCGSGNISVAAYLAKSGELRRYGERYEARQGMQLGRDGRVALRVENGSIFLGGNAVTCVEGTLRVD
jgi:PhzF family phenazine biosynthesis protein